MPDALSAALTASAVLALVAAAAGLAAGVVLFALLRRWEQRARAVGAAGRGVILASLGSLSLVVLTEVGAWAGVRMLDLGSAIQVFADKTFTVLLVLAVTLAGARLGAELMRTYAIHRAGREATSIFVNLTWLAVVVVGLLVVLQTVGVSITPLLTALGVGGLAVALALQDTLSNLFAGLHLLASKKVQVGDYIQLENGEKGYIIDITWRNTTIRKLGNNMLIVPNARLASEVIVNFYRPRQEMAVLVEVGVAYASDLERVERVTVEVARGVMKEVAGGIAAFEPFIRYHTFNQSSIDFTVILRAREVTDQYLLKHEFIKRLHLQYGKEGIQIPFPIRTVVIAESDGNDTKSRVLTRSTKA